MNILSLGAQIEDNDLLALLAVPDVERVPTNVGALQATVSKTDGTQARSSRPASD